MALPLADPNLRHEYKREQVAARSLPLSRFLTLWHLASFDAPTVAVVWAFAFAQVAGVHLQAWIAFLLFSGTWSVYVGDRLLDARRAMHSGRLNSLRERHFFHWRHRRILIPLAACSGALAALLIMLRMPMAIRERDSVLAAAAVAYFSGVHSSPRLPAWLGKIGSKELLVGVLFTSGCAAPALWQMSFGGGRSARVWPLLVCFAYFAALAWCNCRAIESWESTDRENNVSLHTGLLSLAGVVIATALASTDRDASALVAAAAASSILLLALHRVRFRIRSLILRVLADVVLLMPMIVLACGAHSA